MLPEPMRSIETRIVERRRRHRRIRSPRWSVADRRVPLLVSDPATVRGSIRRRVDWDQYRRSVIDERAGRRHRGAVFPDRGSPATIEASPVNALFEPSAVLSSMKALVSVEDNRGVRRPCW